MKRTPQVIWGVTPESRFPLTISHAVDEFAEKLIPDDLFPSTTTNVAQFDGALTVM